MVGILRESQCSVKAGQTKTLPQTWLGPLALYTALDCMGLRACLLQQLERSKAYILLAFYLVPPGPSKKVGQCKGKVLLAGLVRTQLSCLIPFV